MTTAHETSDAFSDETLREQAIFQFAKEAEMKEMLGNLADGQIEFYKAVSNLLFLFRKKYSMLIFSQRLWKNGRGLFPLSSVSVWMFNYRPYP